VTAGGRRRRRVAAVAAALLSCALLAGCSGIPGSGPVDDVRKVAEQVDPTAPHAPDPGQPADQIVRGFISAAARTDYDTPGHSFVQAREYLAPEADKAWEADTSTTPVVILQDQYNAAPTSGDPGTIEVTGTQVGALASDRSYRPVDGKTFKVTLHLVQAGGEWRITNPPDQVILTESGFASAFRPRTVYFLDATGRVVVPDIRYIPDSGTTDLAATRLMDLLLRGPSASISGAARTQLGATAKLRSVSVLVDDNGVAHIDLEGVDVSTPAARQGLVAQIVWTLDPDVQYVQITVNGEPLASLAGAGTSTPAASTPGSSGGPSATAGAGSGPTAGTYSFSDVAYFDPDAVPGTGQAVSDAYYIDPDGAILRVSDSTPMWGQVGTGSLRVRSAALSAATGTLAAVADAPGGGVQLVVGHPFDQEKVAAVMKADSLTQPTFTRSGDEVWVVQNGATQPEVYRVTTATGTPTWTRVPAPGLTGIGTVTAMVLSPDGVRVAVVADNKLYLGSIAPAPTAGGDANSQPGERSALQIGKLSVLREDLSDVGPVTFQDATTLLVGARSAPGAHRTVYQVGIDGQSVNPVSSVNIFADVDSIAAASSDRPMLISFGPPDRVWQLSGSTGGGEWVSPAGAQLLPGSSPFYPT
jgi:predicted small secreted protein